MTNSYKKLTSWDSITKIGKPIVWQDGDIQRTDYLIPMNYHGLRYRKISNELEEYLEEEREYHDRLSKNEGTIILIG